MKRLTCLLRGHQWTDVWSFTPGSRSFSRCDRCGKKVSS